MKSLSISRPIGQYYKSKQENCSLYDLQHSYNRKWDPSLKKTLWEFSKLMA